MNKFKVGDIVTGIKRNGYGYTNENAIMKVIRVEGDYIDVKIITYHGKSLSDWMSEYDFLNIDKFELVKEYKPKQQRHLPEWMTKERT